MKKKEKKQNIKMDQKVKYIYISNTPSISKDIIDY